jgi:hypothetical protein
MPRRWQYQEKVQPVVTPPNTAETVHPEAWMQPPTPPQRNWALRAAAFAIVLAAASSGSQRNFDVKDYPGNGNWRPAYTDIVPRTSQWNYYATLSASSGQAPSDPEQATEPEEPFVDKFGQPPPSIHLRRRNYGVCSGSTFVPPVPLFLDKWFEPPSQPTYSKRAVDLTQTIAPVTVPVAETVTIDKWFEPPSQPLKQPYPFDLFTVPGHQQAFAYIHGYEDHWHPNYPAWLARVRRGLSSGSAYVGLISESVTLDKWYAAPSQPTYLPKRTGAEQGQSVTDTKLLTQQEQVTISRFKATYPDWLPRPYSEATYVASGYTGPVVVSEVVTIDKWWQPSSQPIYLKRSPVLDQDVTDSRLLTQQESVSISKWGQPAPEVARRRRYGVNSGSAFVGLISETVTLDKWFSPASQPLFQPSRIPSLVPEPAFVQVVAAGAEVVTLDKWWHEQPDPVRPPYPYDLFTVPGHQQAFATLHGAYSPMYADYPGAFPKPFPAQLYVSATSFVPLVPTEVVLADKWLPDYPVWLARTYVQPASGAVTVVSTAKESVSVEKFKADYADAVPRLAQRSPVLDQQVIDPTVLLKSGEIVLLDKWFEPASQPTYLAKRSADLRQVLIDPKVLTQQETVSIDRFGPSYVDRVTRLSPIAAQVSSNWTGPVFAGEIVTVDKWFEPTSQPTYLPKRTSELIQIVQPAISLTEFQPVYPDLLPRAIPQPTSGAATVVSTAQETVFVEKFQADYADIAPRLAARCIVLYQNVIDPTVLLKSGEVVTIDKWWQPASQPTYLPKRSAVLDQAVIDSKLLTQKEAVHVDAWMEQPEYPAANLSLKLKVYAAQAASGMAAIDAKQLTLQEAVRIDKFNPDYPSRVPGAFNSAVQQASGGIYMPQPPIETITLDKWWEPASQPTYLPIRSADLTQTVIPPPEKILVDKWWQPTSQPTYLPKRSAELQQFIIDPKPETIRIDKWGPDYQAWINRPFNSAIQAASGETLVLTEIVSFDKWWQPVSQPTYLAKRTAELGQSIIDAGALLKPETVSIDKFGPTYQNWINRIPNMAVPASSGAVFLELQPPNIGFIFASISVTPLVQGTPSVNSLVIAANIKVAS